MERSRLSELTHCPALSVAAAFADTPSVPSVPSPDSRPALLFVPTLHARTPVPRSPVYEYPLRHFAVIGLLREIKPELRRHCTIILEVDLVLSDVYASVSVCMVCYLAIASFLRILRLTLRDPVEQRR